MDQYRFIDFLKVVRKKVKEKRFAIFIDNASFHKANSVKQYAKDNEIELIYSPTYRP